MMPHLLFALLSATASASVLAQPGEMRADTYMHADRADAWAQTASRPCSMDALPQTEKRRMIAEYQRRQRVEGKANADAWATEEGNRFRRRLVAEGVCPPLANESQQTAPARTRSYKKPVLNRKGRTCKNVGVENRMIPGFGGAPMTMALVPVCKD
jgi:hypothetical protein